MKRAFKLLKVLVFSSFLIFISLIAYADNKEINYEESQEEEIEKIPLTLQQCIDIALIYNHKRPISRLAVEIAESQHQQALSSWWPQIKIVSALTTMDQDPNFIFPAKEVHNFSTAYVSQSGTKEGPYAGAPLYTEVYSEVDEENIKLMDKKNAVYSASLMFPVITGGYRSALIERAKLGVAAAKEEVRLTDLEIIFNVKRMYYACILTKNLYKIGKETLDRLEAVYELTESLYKSGSSQVKKTDYLKNKIMVETIRSVVAYLKSNEQLTKAALVHSVGLEWEIEIEIPEDEIPFNPYRVSLKDLVSNSYKFNPNWARLEIGLAAAEAKIKQEKSGFSPKVALTGSLNYIDNAYDKGAVTPHNKQSWVAGVAMEFPIFDGFLTLNRVREARARLDKLKHQKFLLKEGLAIYIKKVFLDMSRAKDQEEASKNALKAAEENRDLNVRAYRDMLVEASDVIEAQLIETLLKAQYQKALYDHIEAQVFLDYIVGKEVAKIFE